MTASQPAPRPRSTHRNPTDEPDHCLGSRIQRPSSRQQHSLPPQQSNRSAKHEPHCKRGISTARARDHDLILTNREVEAMKVVNPATASRPAGVLMARWRRSHPHAAIDVAALSVSLAAQPTSAPAALHLFSRAMDVRAGRKTPGSGGWGRLVGALAVATYSFFFAAFSPDLGSGLRGIVSVGRRRTDSAARRGEGLGFRACLVPAGLTH
jgi:hypothetical protein